MLNALLEENSIQYTHMLVAIQFMNSGRGINKLCTTQTGIGSDESNVKRENTQYK